MYSSIVAQSLLRHSVYCNRQHLLREKEKNTKTNITFRILFSLSYYLSASLSRLSAIDENQSDWLTLSYHWLHSCAQLSFVLFSFIRISFTALLSLFLRASYFSYKLFCTVLSLYSQYFIRIAHTVYNCALCKWCIELLP